MKRSPSEISRIESGERRARRDFILEYAAALGLQNDFFDADFPDEMRRFDGFIDDIVTRLTDDASIHPAPLAPGHSMLDSSPDLPGKPCDLIGMDAIARMLDTMLSAEEAQQKPTAGMLWTARTYNRQTNRIRRQLYDLSLPRFTNHGGSFVHIVRSDPEKNTDDAILWLVKAKKRFARRPKYRTELARHISANNRPIDFYTTGRSGSVLAITHYVGGEPDRALYVPAGGDCLAAYLDIITEEAPDAVRFYLSDDVARYQRDLVAIFNAKSDQVHVGSVFPDVTRPLQHLSVGSDWWKRTAAKISKPEDKNAHEAIIAYANDRRSTARSFADALEHKRAVRFILCQQDLEKWAANKFHADNVTGSAETSQERKDRLDQILAWLRIVNSFDIAVLPRDLWVNLPGLSLTNDSSCNIGWSAISDSFVIVQIADNKEKELYRLIIDNVDSHRRVFGDFSSTWNDLLPSMRDKQTIIGYLTALGEKIPSGDVY